MLLVISERIKKLIAHVGIERTDLTDSGKNQTTGSMATDKVVAQKRAAPVARSLGKVRRSLGESKEAFTQFCCSKSRERRAHRVEWFPVAFTTRVKGSNNTDPQ